MFTYKAKIINVYDGNTVTVDIDCGFHIHFTEKVRLYGINTQEILGRKGKPRSQKHEFSFTGLIRCGECGCMITAEVKKKIIKQTGISKLYTYYRCTHKKKEFKCKQKAISKDKLEIQIKEELERYQIMPEFRDWALEVLRENNDKEIEERTKIHDSINKTIILYAKST